MNRITTSLSVMAGLCLLTSGAPKAAASTLLLTDSNLGSAFQGPFVQVDVSLADATHANLTFTSLTTGGLTYLMSIQAAAVNVNGPFAYAPASVSYTALPGFSPDTFSVDSGNLSEYGAFNFILRQTGGFLAAVNSLSFQLTKSTGSWTSAEDVLTLNNKNQLAASHIFALDPQNPGSAVNNGFAAGDAFNVPGGDPGGSPVPEPASTVLFGTGLLGFSIMLRRRLNRR